MDDKYNISISHMLNDASASESDSIYSQESIYDLVIIMELLSLVQVEISK